VRGSPPSLYIFNKSKRARGHLHCSTVTEQINSMHDSSNYFKHWDGHTSDDSKCGASRQKIRKNNKKKQRPILSIEAVLKQEVRLDGCIFVSCTPFS